MASSSPLNVIIAGGGLSGLALAQGLRKDGHSATVYERDPDFTRKVGYMLHMNADGGEALRRVLPEDLFELYLETSRRSYERKLSTVWSKDLHEITSQPHVGPPNPGPREHTGVHRRTLRAILRARLGDAFQPGRPIVSYEELPDRVVAHFADGTSAEGDLLVGADGINSAVRAQRLPDVTHVPGGVQGIGVFGRTPITPRLLELLPDELLQGVNFATDGQGRVLIGAYQARQRPDEAARTIAPDVELEPVDDYVMTSASVSPGTVIPPNDQWTESTPLELRESMLRSVEGWHPGVIELVGTMEPSTIFQIPFGFLMPAEPWAPSRVTLVGDAAHAMLPTLGIGANLALLDAKRLLEEISGAAGAGTDVVEAVGRAEAGMREYVYPFMEITMQHDKAFGGGGLERPESA
ncbi:FAD-dependent monooxygenase [Nocardioides mangrovicus]|uniref:FAD-dependent monooxygenase n=1 Tax=Nocardioides mangrovicus TaxID=2478913 RepID=A0A3L8P4G7_9ACTN|nr:NAD(P)/FAD-dependent oxidoreductase [Nocardioides mangrovicus]RLV49984.1 FAD-dependent monooxygenase [Nocardioides mangrovicus]